MHLDVADRPAAPARTVRVLDLFAGAGGLTEGFAQASDRFETVAAVELDVAAAASYAANHGAGTVYAGPIESWLGDNPTTDADIIVGGPPCQGFSTLGKQDVEDERNGLWRSYADTIHRVRPQYFVVENVAGFMSSPQFRQFTEAASATGTLRDYRFEARELNAADYGAAQARRRAVLIGHHRDLPFPGFPEPTTNRAEWTTVRDAIGDVRIAPDEVLPVRHTSFAGRVLPGEYLTRELHIARSYRDVSLQRFAHIPYGGNRFNLPDDLLAPCWRSHKSGSGDVMGRLVWEKPSVTIRTEFFKPEKGRYLHPTADRALTHLEAARLQGFPDDYRWVGSRTAIARQIGNAVPIPLGKAIAAHLLRQLE